MKKVCGWFLFLKMDFLDEYGSLEEYGFFWVNMDLSSLMYMALQDRCVFFSGGHIYFSGCNRISG